MPGKQHPPIETELTVGQVAARAGVAVSTLHFYESKGLIHSWRNAGNQRRYPREVLRRVAVIKVAQRTGIPLAEIQAALSSLPENRTPTAADWKRLSARWRDALDARINSLIRLRDQLDGRPLHRIVCTHHHPDHAGLAAFLLERHPGAEVWMSAGEDAVMQRLASTWLDPRVRDARIAAYAAEGLAVTEQLRPYVVLDSYRGAMSGIPRVARHFADGEVLETGAHRWRAIALRGHTDEQLVFANEAARLLIAGDQVLPRITSNVGIYPERADEDPVASYLASFDRLAELPPDTLVLPSHGNPFRGLHARLGQLRRHHELTLARLREQLDVPRTAVELAQRLFVRELDPLNTVLATGETLAHVRHLVARGEAAMTEDPATGLRRYVGVG